MEDNDEDDDDDNDDNDEMIDRRNILIDDTHRMTTARYCGNTAREGNQMTIRYCNQILMK